MGTNSNKIAGIRQRTMSGLLVMMFALVFFQVHNSPCFAESVALSWDPNSESDLAGYKVYYTSDVPAVPFDGTEAAEGASPIDVHKQPTALISGLDPGRTHYFAVTAYNSSGVESDYSSTVTIPESVAPFVALSSPAADASVSGTVVVAAVASDNVGVSTVEFYSNGELLSAGNEAPYTYNWNTALAANGSYILTAKAYDASGNVGQSGNVTVTVTNGTAAVPEPYSMSDALLALRIAVGTISPTNEQRIRADVAPIVNGVPMPDGRNDISDALVILADVVGIRKLTW